MGADDRRSAREKVILTAEVEETAAGSTFPVRVSNVSQYGALVVGVGLPPSETEIIFRCNGLEIAGWIAWHEHEECGVTFDPPLPAAIVECLKKEGRWSHVMGVDQT